MRALPYIQANDLSELLRVFDDLEHLAQSFDADALGSLRQTRSVLDKAVDKMDGLEAGFDRIAEKSCE
jgi:autophagy-related protein 11